MKILMEIFTQLYFLIWVTQWQVISKFITCLVKIDIRYKSDVLKAKLTTEERPIVKEGGKGSLSVSHN